MRGIGPWVRGMGTWHHRFFTGPPIYLKKNGPGPVHGTMPLVPILKCIGHAPVDACNLYDWTKPWTKLTLQC